MANSRNWLQQLKDNLNKVTREFGGMKNNVKKHKCDMHKPAVQQKTTGDDDVIAVTPIPCSIFSVYSNLKCLP